MMEETGEELANLTPMRVRQDSVQSTIADYLAHEAIRSSQSDLLESDGIIDGVNVSAYFERPSTSASAVGETNDDLEFNEPLERFMRNEIAYNEFMQMTGGVGLDEEEADYDVSEGAVECNKRSRIQFASQSQIVGIDVENEAADDGYDVFAESEELPSTSFTNESPISKIAPHERSLEEVDEDRLLGIPLELRNSESFGETVPGAKVVGIGGERRMKTNKTLDALIGQANVIYAKGQTKEALTMLLEVIRQEPRNPEPYRQVADIYNDLNRPQKSLQYGLLAAHLNGNRTSAVEWADLGDYALKLNKNEEAAACYGRAIRADSSNHFYYEKRIDALEKAGLNVLAMRTRFMAAQSVDRGQVDFEWFRNMITIAADHYIKMNDEEKAVAALETFVLRSREYNRDASEQHKTVVRLLMNSHRFEDAAKSVFALCPGITALDDMGRFAVEIKYNNASYTVKPFPPEKVHRFVVGESLPTVFLARLVICFIRLGRKDLAPTLVDKLFERVILPQDQQVYLDIARAYHAVDCVAHAQKYMEHLLARPHFLDVAEAWYLYGLFLFIRKRYEEACKAYQHALDLQPSHVDARINYSTIQQRLGMVDEAFETLREYVLDAGSSLPDERLLVRQADFLFERKRMDEFARCVRMLLAPHFYEIYLNNMALLKKRLPTSERGTVCHGIRVQAFNAVRGSAFEKYVKRVGQLAAAEERAPSEITSTQLHDYCFKLLETLLQQKRCLDALHVCCFAYLQPLISKNTKTMETFQNLLLYCSIRSHVWPLAFEYLRWFHTLSVNNNPLLLPSDRDLLLTRIFNAMNFVFCHSQNVSYHRYIMRALARSPGNLALQMISGNNSLITGAYRHALGEYLHVWKLVPDNPLVCMLIGLTFVHMSCKKDIFSRHMVALRGLAFMNRYQQLRGDNQETYYNIGRMFHQMNILPLAMYFYGKCLKIDIPKVVVTDEATGDECAVEAEEYDLRPMAAHNLALIYLASGNHYVARNLLERYCCIE
ncbi:TPR repeat family protein [Acanthocheilonema viteae]